MSNLFNKAKAAAGGYKDQETGKSGYAGVAAEGQEAFKNYKEDKADGSVDWKKQATGLFGDVKAGLGGGKTEGGQPAAGQAAAEQQPPAQ